MIPAWRAVSECGVIKHGTDLCGSVNVFDEMSVGKMLEAAGIQLDSFHEGNGVPKRYIGSGVFLTVTYTDMDPVDFWTWPFGRKPKYTYNFREMHHTSSPYNTTRYQSARAERANSTHRHVEHHAGIMVLTLLEGVHGTYSLSHFLMALTIFLAMLQIAKTMVNTFLVKLYSWTRFSHVAAMHQFYQMDVSPDEEAAKEATAKGGVGFKALYAEGLDRQFRMAENCAMGTSDSTVPFKTRTGAGDAVESALLLGLE